MYVLLWIFINKKIPFIHQLLFHITFGLQIKSTMAMNRWRCASNTKSLTSIKIVAHFFKIYIRLTIFSLETSRFIHQQ